MFDGEDPLQPEVRAVLEDSRKQLEPLLEEMIKELGERLGPGARGATRRAIDHAQETRRAAQRQNVLALIAWGDVSAP